MSPLWVILTTSSLCAVLKFSLSSANLTKTLNVFLSIKGRINYTDVLALHVSIYIPQRISISALFQKVNKRRAANMTVGPPKSEAAVLGWPGTRTTARVRKLSMATIPIYIHDAASTRKRAKLHAHYSLLRPVSVPRIRSLPKTNAARSSMPTH